MAMLCISDCLSCCGSLLFYGPTLWKSDCRFLSPLTLSLEAADLHHQRETNAPDSYNTQHDKMRWASCLGLSPVYGVKAD
jgi:hypothetical protein